MIEGRSEGLAARMATQRLENVHFGGFMPEDCGLRSVAIAFNPTSRDWSPLLVARSWKCHEIAVNEALFGSFWAFCRACFEQEMPPIASKSVDLRA